MKKSVKNLLILALAVLTALSFAACSEDGLQLTKTPNQGVTAGTSEKIESYAHTAYYELERPADVKIAFEGGKIQKVSFMYRVLSSDDWSLKNDVLTVKKGVFAKETAGDKRLRVFVDNQYVEITLRMVTKVIRTVDDFNSIRENMNGVYVLGNDIDFSNQMFWPIGKAVTYSSVTYDSEGKPSYKYSNKSFEGVFDGMGYSVKNVTINALDYAPGEDGNGQGPSLDSSGGGFYFGQNYTNGIFMTTSANAKILNTSFDNITVNGKGLNGSVAGTNGGLIKNCRVTCSLSHQGYDSEKAGGIAGLNAGGDSAGKIENCLVVYKSGGGDRGIADWNSGTIKNCYAATVDDYVLHVAYDSETGKVPDDFDYDDYTTEENFRTLFGNYTIPAFPGSASWVNGTQVYYKDGDIIKSDVVRKEFMLDPANFPEEDGWDRAVWNFTYGVFPSLKIQSM